MLQNLIEWERESGYKAKYIAEKLELSESQYSKIKHGANKPPIEMAERLKIVFGVRDPIKLLKNDKGGD